MEFDFVFPLNHLCVLCVSVVNIRLFLYCTTEAQSVRRDGV